MKLAVSGRVKMIETGWNVADVVVEAYDADVVHDDLLGKTTTDRNGEYAIPFDGVHKYFGDRPDVYLMIKTKSGRLIKSTRGSFLRDVEKDVKLDVDVSCWTLVEAGLVKREQLPRELAAMDTAVYLRQLTLDRQSGAAEAACKRIEADLERRGSALELLKGYMEGLRQSADNNDPIFADLGVLFARGLTPAALEGHHYGVALGLRMGAEHRGLSHVDNIVGLLWGATLEDESPWVGKSLRRLDQGENATLTGQGLPPGGAFLGINHFNQLTHHPANSVAFHALTWWLELTPAPEAERTSWGYESNGGNFVACVAPSVWSGSPRQVFRLNYRWPALHNRPPLAWLIDEVVQIADGLYLGQLLFASKRLLGRFDASRPPEDYAYLHMGYFALWDQRWNAEARRLYPFLEIPVTAPGLVGPAPSVSGTGARLAPLKLDPSPPSRNDAVFAAVENDLRAQPTVMHLLKQYSDALQDSLDNDSPYFARLGELFLRGAPVEKMEGFYRGALVSWHGDGLFKLLHTNALNLAWRGFAGRFSTWTGKHFSAITPERLAQMTDGHETGAVPTYWGANTQALRTMKEREVGKLMELANIWSEPVPSVEAAKNGYDLKNFFFIARAAESVNASCRGKRIFQFNYRWPKLRTIVPDCLCLDEMVEIAEGLFLGQLMYATDVVKPYDPGVAPAAYQYGMFGYFLLMTEEWHQIRLRIGFDLDNT